MSVIVDVGCLESDITEVRFTYICPVWISSIIVTFSFHFQDDIHEYFSNFGDVFGIEIGPNYVAVEFSTAQ